MRLLLYSLIAVLGLSNNARAEFVTPPALQDKALIRPALSLCDASQSETLTEFKSAATSRGFTIVGEARGIADINLSFNGVSN